MKTIIFLLLTVWPALAQYGYKTAYGLPANNPPSSGLTPPPLSGYTLWLTVRDPATMFTNHAGTIQAVPSSGAGGRVSFWKDKSTVAGTNNVYSSSDGNARPNLTNNVPQLNNQSALRYFATDQNNLISSNALLSTPNTSSLTVLVAGIMDAAGIYGTLFSWGGEGAAGEMRFRQNAAAFQMELYHDGADIVTGNVNTNQAYIYSFRFNNTGNTIEIWTNLVVASSGGDGANLPGSTPFGVGWQAAASGAFYYWNGYISEVIAYPSALSNTDMTNAINYLKSIYIP